MRKKRLFIPVLIMTGLAIAACGKSDKVSDAEAVEETAELQTIEFDTGSDQPVETADPVQPVTEVPVEEAPVVEEVPVAEEAPAEALQETAEEPAPAESSSADYSVEDIGETTLYTTDTVNMRKGPSSTDFEVAGKLSSGSEVKANGKVNGYKGDGKSWYRIKRSDGSGDVFIIAEYLSETKPEKKDETTAETATTATTADADAAAAAAAKKAADDAAAQQAAAQQAAAQQAAATPAASGGTHNLNGLIVNDAEYKVLLDTWRWATNGSDEEAEHYVLKHNAGDLEAVLKSKGLR